MCVVRIPSHFIIYSHKLTINNYILTAHAQTDNEQSWLNFSRIDLIRIELESIDIYTINTRWRHPDNG